MAAKKSSQKEIVDTLLHIVEHMAMKDDVKNMATKDDIKNMATKDDIKNMATKDDIKNMATKDDIKNMVTKDDARDINQRLEALEEGQKEILEELKPLSRAHDKDSVTIIAQGKRITRIEKHLGIEESVAA